MVKDNLALVLDPVEETHRDTEELNWCSISLSEIIARGSRLEATVYDVEGRKARAVIENCKCEQKKITGPNGIAEAYTCARLTVQDFQSFSHHQFWNCTQSLMDISQKTQELTLTLSV